MKDTIDAQRQVIGGEDAESSTLDAIYAHRAIGHVGDDNIA